MYGGRRPALFLTGPAKVALPNLSADAIADELSGIYIRTAPTPWGPWSAPQTLYSAYSPAQEGYCTLLHYEEGHPVGPPGFRCPPEHLSENAALARNVAFPSEHGVEYGAGMIATCARPIDADNAEGLAPGAWIYWLMSTWNPYGVVLMRTALGTAPTTADVRVPDEADYAVLERLLTIPACPEHASCR